jgi:hypothetical protein
MRKQESLPYRIESDSKTYERQKRSRRNRFLGVIAVVLATTIASGVAIGCSKGASNDIPKTPKIESEKKDKYGDVFDKEVKTIVLKNGARIRNEPIVPDVDHGDPDNLLTQYKGEDLSMNVQGAYIHEDEANGKWIGIKAVSIENQYPRNIDSGLGFTDDNDDILWVNSQRASTQTNSIE